MRGSKQHAHRDQTSRLIGRPLAGAFMLGAFLMGSTLSPSVARAQPNRADRTLKTPTRLPFGKLKPSKTGAAGKITGARSATGGVKKSGSGATGASGGPGKIGARDTIEYKGPPQGGIEFNMTDVELTTLVEWIMQVTGKRFIFGSKLRQIKASVMSPPGTRIGPGEAYAAFLSVLESNGLTVVPHGRFLKIVESQGIASETTSIVGTQEPVPYTDRFVTRLYKVKHVDAGEVSTVLSKFKSRDADITVYAPSNLLIITDTGSNIRRMLRIVEELDAGGAGEQIYMQPVHNSSAADLAASLNEMLDLGAGSRAKILAEERNNMLVIVANESDYERVLELIKIVDKPNAGNGQIHVLPLQHARCDELSGTLSAILGGGSPRPRPQSSKRATGRTAAARRPTSSGSVNAGADSGLFEGDVKLNCDEATNSLVAVSSLRDYARLRNVIDKLDQPRRQVFIEAVIMDVNVDHTSEIGTGFHAGATSALGGGSDTVFYGGSNAQQSLLGVPSNLEALAFGVRGPDLDGTSQLLGTGVSIPAFGVVLHALARSGDSNVLATPHILATDNIIAEISIGQNIPLQTNVGAGLSQLAGLAGGGAASALGGLGGLAGGFSAPRQDVGIKLSITPHINESNEVRMEIQEEFSDAGSPVGALGAVPINKRTANTTVIVKDQQTVVIGGLVREGQINGETKVPILGDIPVLGALFRQTSKQTQKTNLLLVLTPHVIRDQNDLRRIFERKMQERQEFLDRYFVFDESLPWEPAPDYDRTNGLVEHIRQTQLKLAAREELAKELRPDKPKEHERVRPIQLPAMAGASKTATGGVKKKVTRPKSKTKKRTNRSKPKGKFTVPGSLLRKPKRYRVE